jgi:DNA gyrase subunit A
VDYDETCDRFVFLTQQGRLKWLLSQEFDELTGRGLGAIKLKEEDALGWVVPAEAGSEIVVATAMARLLRFPLQAVPEMGRAALGNTVLRLLKQETMAGLLALETDADVLLFSRFGYVRQVALQSLRQGQPGHLGTPVWTFAKKTDSVIALVALQPDQDVMVVTDQNRVAYLNLSDLPDASARPSGAPWVKIKSGEKVVQVIPLKSEASPS